MTAHDHGPRLSDDAFSPDADACPSTLADLPCGCQDVHYACGAVDREHDHVECPGAPRCTERCDHGTELPYCDACASVPRMSRWAAGLDGYQLADALETLDRDPRYYRDAERKAVLIEAARRVRP